MKGDTGDDDLYQSFNFSSDHGGSFDMIKDLQSNKELLRASIQ